MRKISRIPCLTILCFTLLLQLAACGKRPTLDARIIGEYLKGLKAPDDLQILSIERAEFTGEIYYCLNPGSCTAEEQETKRLYIVYDTAAKTSRYYFGLELMYGSDSEILDKWDSRKSTAFSVHYFTDAERTETMKEALAYCHGE